MRLGVIAALVTALLVTGLRGQDDASRTTLVQQISLDRVMDLCAEKLGYQIQYDSKSLSSVNVTLRIDRGLLDDELWSLANELLTANGYTTVVGADHSVLTVTKIGEAPGRARVVNSLDEDRASGFVSLLVEIQNSDAKTVTTALQTLVSKPGGSITHIGDSDLILISDVRSRIDQVLPVLERLDQAETPPIIQPIPLRHVEATQLVALITSATTAMGAMSNAALEGKLIPVPKGDAVLLIAPESEAVRWRTLIEQFDQRQPVTSLTYSPRHFSVEEVATLMEQVARDESPRGSGDQWQVIQDQLTGSIIVTATPSEHEQIQALLDRLDQVPAAAHRPVRSFRIRNRSVGEIVEVLSRLMSAGALSAVSAEERGLPRGPRQRTYRDVLPEGTTPTIGTPADAPRSKEGTARPLSVAVDDTLSLTADEATNTLIAVGDSRRLRQLEDLIRSLDVRQPQVMLEVLVISLTDGDTLDLGVELQKLEISGNTLFALGSLFGLDTPGLQESTIAGSGGTALVLDPGSFRILIRALETLNQGRALNMPKVLVNNNEDATLDSLLSAPFTSTNASNTVATTSFGGTEEAGTSVTVRPQIAEGDHLVLRYAVSLSAFVGESSDPALPPPRQQNNLESVVTIPDGYTVVVGGLESVTESEATSQVPLLGSIPLLGEAFKNRSKSNSRTRFYVFVRANVFRHTGFEDLKYASDRDVATTGVDDGWPEVRPQVIR